jgi:hypothetical protein
MTHSELCFVVNTEKQTYRPVPIIPPLSFSQLPLQTHFDQVTIGISFSLGPNHFSGVEMAMIWWYM